MYETIDYPYSKVELIDRLPGYDTSPSVMRQVDWIREIIESDAYYWRGCPFPPVDTEFELNETKNGSITLPPGTYVTSINYYQDKPPSQEEQPSIVVAKGVKAKAIIAPRIPAPVLPGVKFKLYDKGTKASIFYGDYAYGETVASNMQIQYGVGTSNPPSDLGMNLDNPFGPNYLLSPFIITPPGVLNWEVVNMATGESTIQFMVACAVPINPQSTSMTQIRRV
jgi:hypothetical protein